MKQLASVVRMNTRLFHNCLDGSEEVFWRRPSESTNALGFLVLHLIDARYYMIKLIGLPADNPFAAVGANVNSMAELKEHPGLNDLLSAWNQASERLNAGLEGVSSDQLTHAVEERFPLDDRTLAGALEFLVNHESYHIGQMAFIRRTFGLPAMRYT